MRIIRPKKNSKKLKFVVVKNKGYGKLLKGSRIFYEGSKPKKLSKDGTFKFGKNILEILLRKFAKKFHLILTSDTDSITLERKIYRVRISARLLDKLNGECIECTRDIKNDILGHIFSQKFPEHFKTQAPRSYVPGTLSNILDRATVTRLSSKDRDTLLKFLPDFIASESHSSINLLKAKAEIESLEDLCKDLEEEIKSARSESWWQTYIKKNILIIQQGYIKAVEKINLAIGDTKFPDFSLVTHDNYLDILEIKKPNTPLLKPDRSRNNYFWDTELSKAIIQTENYLSSVTKHSDAVRNFLRDTFKIDLQVLRPRGIILAGNAGQFTSPKEKDDFRLLAHSLKNITVLTYDELLIRLQNYIKVLKDFSKPTSPKK